MPDRQHRVYDPSLSGGEMMAADDMVRFMKIVAGKQLQHGGTIGATLPYAMFAAAVNKVFNS
jgi:hypothetical protein